MKDRRNFYRTLQLQPDAPGELVRVNYRTLMYKLGAHPDLGGEDWRAAHLNQAYATLSNSERRAAYDRELLSQYGLEVIAQGLAKPKVGRASRRRRGRVNRRNYYRILEVQRDAPVAILEAAGETLRGVYPDRSALIEEALALLVDRQKREIYDRLLEAYGHEDALARMAAGHDAPSHRPLISSYCAFCKTPHDRRIDQHGDARCVECSSPLFAPPRHFLGLARRALTRVARCDLVTLYTDWPAEGTPGRVVDLSPTGLRCETVAPLEVNDLVKIESEEYDAVGAVAHVQTREPSTNAGLRFLTVQFKRALGNFRVLKT